jgi:PhnB protein
MFAPQVMINGECRQAIQLYEKAFNGIIKTIIPDPEQENLVRHAEIIIHDQILMMNDFGGDDGYTKSGGYQLSVRFETEEALEAAYSILKEGSTVVSNIQATDYSPCVVRFIDRYDVRRAFWV